MAFENMKLMNIIRNPIIQVVEFEATRCVEVNQMVGHGGEPAPT